ncbi:MAG TPA: thioredoxin-like domain-containing protein [Chitinophagaceae bacterium]|nr:thioredoxin-like domain-containing protein [Chitinophagaceae bacterium]
MSKRLFLLLPLIIITTALVAQNGAGSAPKSTTPSKAPEGYNIPISVKPYKNTYVYLGYHYGKRKALADSALLDENGKGVFKGPKPLGGGIYFVVSPKKEILFELLIDKQQHFSIEADSSSMPEGIKFTNSPDNTLFLSYTRNINETGRKAAEASQAFQNSTNPAEKEKLQQLMQQHNQYVVKYRDSIQKKHPNTFLSTLLKAMKEPVIPPASQHPGGKYDTMFAFRYFKSHYWDEVSLTDDRLLRTPILETKLDKYYKDLVAPDPDSIFREVDYMLLLSRSNKDMFRYLMVYFVQKYINPEYMGQDAVFVNIWEKYINTGQADFFTEQYKKHMSDRAYSLMANLIGIPAAELLMVDTLGKPMPLSRVQAEFIVLCFWDPTCGHCKEVVPRVDSIFQASWKNQGVKVYGVMVEGGKDNWLKFIRENNLKDWLHVYQTEEQKNADIAAGKPSYRQLYDVYQTPVLYLLDKNKRIIAKKLNHQQIDEVIKIKRQKPSNQ